MMGRGRFDSSLPRECVRQHVENRRVHKVAWKEGGDRKVMRDLGQLEEGARQGSCRSRGLLIGLQTWGKDWRLPSDPSTLDSV